MNIAPMGTASFFEKKDIVDSGLESWNKTENVMLLKTYNCFANLYTILLLIKISYAK